MTYDPALRRDTPLALELKDRIRLEGPIEFGVFLGECLWNERYGYYATKTVIGPRGDFITAPEISQTFGELLGLWSAVVWQQMGSPARVSLVELGGGRGTMMADAVKAVASVPGLTDALAVTIMEGSPSLSALQKSTLSHVRVPISWTERFPGAAPCPSIVIANEFLDVFGLNQFVKTDDGWRGQAVGLDVAGNLAMIISQHGWANADAAWPEAPIGSIWSAIDDAGVAGALSAMSKHHPLAAVFIDYGHIKSAFGDTLQAVRGHAFEHPLTSPGEADLSIQVDFASVSTAMRRAGFAVDGPTTQGEFLGRLGIVERASKLMSANPAKAGEIETGVARLMAVPGMGDRFKVIGIRSPGLPPLPGF